MASSTLRIIGLMSGTSVDGVDAAIVEVAGTGFNIQVTFLAGETYPYPVELREQILAVCGDQPLSMAELAALDDAIAAEFAQAALKIQSGQPPADLIASHGQTVFHRPPKPSVTGRSDALALGYSLQLGRGAAIARLTGIPTMSNFRAADIAAGGQGAPLVPPIDVALLSHPSHHRCVQNIGGIGNLTYLPPWDKTTEAFPEQVRGWDTGPGNTLIDLAVQHFSQGTRTYDAEGSWAALGTPCSPLVEHWLQQPFFQQPPPKSTGRELFGVAYLKQCLADAEGYHLSPADFLATLTELTAASIVYSYRKFLPQFPDEVLVCGGGSRNLYLKQRLQHYLGTATLLTTDQAGIHGDFKEAIAFAVLGFWRYHGTPGNLPAVTGAKHPVLLGDLHPIGPSFPLLGMV